MPRTVMTRGGEGAVSQAVLDARETMQELLPAALDAYEALLSSGKPADRRLAAKDVLEACRVIGGESGASGEGSMTSENVIKLVQEIGKAFGVRREDVEGAKFDRATPVNAEVEVVTEVSKTSGSGLSQDVIERVEAEK